MTRKPAILFGLLAGAALLFGWGSDIHTGIVHAALMAIPPQDRVQERWGAGEVARLEEYVQMADWINTLVSQKHTWAFGDQTLQQAGPAFFANDYLLFPSSPNAYQHLVPDVQRTYRPFFLRALQAIRTESPVNASRWTGSLLHFITDTGSPPHAAGVRGPDHTKMENWLDPSLIDLSQYHPNSLGSTDAAAIEGLLRRMDGLIAFSAIRAKQLLPLSKLDDRAHMEPVALESAAETSRVAADVIHTLLQLTAAEASGGGALTAQVSAPALDGTESLPAKMVVLGTDYSTMSDQALPAFHVYRGTFSLRNIPPGAYRLAIERVGNQTLYPPPVIVKAGETVRAAWTLQAARVAGNLAQNPDLTLHWLTPDAPDHWRLDAPRHQWVSDNIPVVAGHAYQAGSEAGKEPASSVELQWMAHAWEAMKTPPVPLGSVTAPTGALFVRFVVKAEHEPSKVLREVFIKEDLRR